MRRGLLVAAMALSGCILQPQNIDDSLSEELPAMGWDHRPEAADWTVSTMSAVQTVGAPLLEVVPADINEWCPGYVDADSQQRAAFWTGLLSILAKHESTWNPQASGGGGAWIGLVQIDPRTAQGYGCQANTVAELKDGAANLACAVRIAAHTVPRDGYVGTGRKGFAADWGPFLSDRKRSDMVNWTRSQAYCQG